MEAVAWVTGIGVAVTFLVGVINFWRDTDAKRRLAGQATISHVRNLAELLDDHSLKEVRDGEKRLKEINDKYENGIYKDTPEKALEDYKYFTEIEDKAYPFLRELELTYSLIDLGVMSKDVLKALGAGYILSEYTRFFQPIVEIGIKDLSRGEVKPKYHEDPWSGIQKLVEELNNPKPKGRIKLIVDRLVTAFSVFRRWCHF